MLIVTPIVEFCNCSMSCCTLLCVHSSFAIILMGIESWLLCFVCLPGLVIVVWLFLAKPQVCLQFVIVVFPDHTHLLFLKWTKVQCENLFLAKTFKDDCI